MIASAAFASSQHASSKVGAEDSRFPER